MVSNAACYNPQEETAKRIESLCRILRTVERGGGRFVGFQPGPKSYIALFRHPLTATTLGLPVPELTSERVTAKIVQAVQARFAFPDDSLFGIPIFLPKI